MPRPHEHEPRDVTGAERPVAVAFSPSKNNSHEHHQRHASNWNQLSKLPAGSRFRSVCEPFWERAIKNSEQLKAEPLPQVLHVPRVAMESLVCQSRRFLLLVVGRLRTRAWRGAGGWGCPSLPPVCPQHGAHPGGTGAWQWDGWWWRLPRHSSASKSPLGWFIPAFSPAGCQHIWAGAGRRRAERAGATSRLEHCRARPGCSGGI